MPAKIRYYFYMQIRLELFVQDIDASRRFYADILGFHVDSADPGGYSRLSLGSASIALNPAGRIPKRHPSRPEPGDRTGLGYEINLIVKEIEPFYAAVQANGGEIAEPLRRRPWGAQDFCISDPDGNYIRITT
jgi:catechol 2,3-dioxygenase-like lactoylglutathione lyase family enzyme